mmetsp:Transcript_39204/g.91894  ORF Transcript_39204/g.91894 Transcript_39204/m.91894 type:complete len:223 (-) Transcript_39204:1149-1817(-)
MARRHTAVTTCTWDARSWAALPVHRSPSTTATRVKKIQPPIGPTRRRTGAVKATAAAVLTSRPPKATTAKPVKTSGKKFGRTRSAPGAATPTRSPVILTTARRTSPPGTRAGPRRRRDGAASISVWAAHTTAQQVTMPGKVGLRRRRTGAAHIRAWRASPTAVKQATKKPLKPGLARRSSGVAKTTKSLATRTTATTTRRTSTSTGANPSEPSAVSRSKRAV